MSNFKLVEMILSQIPVSQNARDTAAVEVVICVGNFEAPLVKVPNNQVKTRDLLFCFRTESCLSQTGQ